MNENNKEVENTEHGRQAIAADETLLGEVYGVVKNKLYRYDSVFHASIDEWDNVYRDFSPTLYLHEYVVFKETKCGVWITFEMDLWKAKKNTDEYGYFFKKFVNMKARKKYANITPELALHDFIKRKERQVSILEGNLDDAKKALHEGKLKAGLIEKKPAVNFA